MSNSSLDSLKKLFAQLPGIGPRQATRLVLALLEMPKETLESFAENLKTLKKTVRMCSSCHNLVSTPPFQNLCLICRNPKRNNRIIMVVEKVTDLESIEKAGQYHGLYHILGGTIDPTNGIQPEHLTIASLKKRVADIEKKQQGPLEVILATNPTTYGDVTALFIEKQIKKQARQMSHPVRVSRLARGLSVGSLLEYVDEQTLRDALRNRI